jgi:hypothetical protein
VLGLRQTLVSLDLRELREGAPAGVVAPNSERRREPRVLAIDDVGVLEVPLSRVHDDPVADPHVRHVLAHGVDDPGGVGAHDVEVRRLAPASLCLRDVDGHAAGGPHVVEVDAGGHHHDERVHPPDLGDVDDLVVDGVLRLAVAVGPHELRVHPRRHLPDRWNLADLVQVLAHGSHPSGCRRCGRRNSEDPSEGPSRPTKVTDEGR